MTPKPQNTNFHQKNSEPIPVELYAIGKQIVDAAYAVHNNPYCCPGKIPTIR